MSNKLHSKNNLNLGPYTGAEFNKLNLGPFYKITNKNELHNGFQYVDGLNIDTIPFCTAECAAGGLYFANKANIFHFFNFGMNIRTVQIPDDAQVSIEDYKFKSSKIILLNKSLISDSDLWNDSEFCNLAIKHNGMLLEFVKVSNKNQSLYEIALRQSGWALQFVEVADKNQSLYEIALRQICF